jgi:hypothetical protein
VAGVKAGRIALLAVMAWLVLGVLPRAAAEGDAAIDVRGTWTGPWYLGMTSGVATLTLRGEAALEGSLQLTNNERFGTAARPLSEAQFESGQLRFKVTGEDGQRMTAQLPVAGEGTRMKGLAKYSGYNIKFELTRQQR